VIKSIKLKKTTYPLTDFDRLLPFLEY